MRTLLALLFAHLLAASVAAASPFRTEAEEEARVRAIAALLRCPVCQSESILESQSGTAREMMVILREQVAEGRDREAIIEHFRSRYGDFVLLYPPASGAGIAVWLLPAVLLGLGAAAYAAFLRRGRRASAALRKAAAARPPLDEKRLEALEP